jgi:hypothetical protein
MQFPIGNSSDLAALPSWPDTTMRAWPSRHRGSPSSGASGGAGRRPAGADREWVPPGRIALGGGQALELEGDDRSSVVRAVHAGPPGDGPPSGVLAILDARAPLLSEAPAPMALAVTAHGADAAAWAALAAAAGVVGRGDRGRRSAPCAADLARGP